MNFAFADISFDLCSLIFNCLEFILNILNHAEGSIMHSSVVVVIGFNMVGSNSMRCQKMHSLYSDSDEV